MWAMPPKIKNKQLKTPAPRQQVVHLGTTLNQAISLHRRGQLNHAKALYEYVLSIQPNQIDALNLLGVVANQSKNYLLACELIGKAIAIDPNVADFHSNLGNALTGLGQFEQAVASYDKAIAIKPDYFEAYANRGVALKELKDLSAAIVDFDKAIALKPNYAQAYCNRGNALKDLKQLHAAVEDYDRAIAAMPDFVEPYWCKSLALLLDGNFAEGWELYEWRWKLSLERRNFTQPLWLGAESLVGKSILLHSEQGLGDTLQFCRFAPLVANLGARVFIEVPSTLVELLRGLTGVSNVIAKGSPLPSFDYQCPLLSLPFALKTRIDSIPLGSGYLHSDPHKVDVWSRTFGAKTKPRVGIAWSGSAGHKIYHDRSIALSAIASHLPREFEYFSLQKELRDVDRLAYEADSNIKIKYFGDQISDFADTAAICQLMDFVISVDTSVAHLAGALGKETWVLLPFVPDWRWLLDRNDSPWYDSMKLYRQNADGDWSGVISRVYADLSARALRKPY
jgi:tetratricopeptide (TPR) repeat protein